MMRVAPNLSNRWTLRIAQPWGGELAGLVGKDVGVLSVHVGSDYHDACL